MRIAGDGLERALAIVEFALLMAERGPDVARTGEAVIVSCGYTKKNISLGLDRAREMAKDRESKRLARLSGEIKTPPMSQQARIEAGFLPRQLPEGVKLSMPRSRPMSAIGPRCHELRIQDENRIWRIVYRIDPDVIVIAGVFPKTTQATGRKDIENCKATLKRYDADAQENHAGKGK